MNVYCIVSDDDGHHYVIPAHRENDWDRYINDGDFQNEPLPDWADEINGPVSIVKFTNYDKSYE